MGNATFRCLLIFVAVLSGCSTTPDRQIPSVELLAADSPSADAPRLSYSIQAWKDAEGTKAASAAVLNQVELELIEVLQLSNRFGRIVENAADADVTLQLSYKEHSTPGARMSAFLTAVSLSLIPSEETVYIEVSASVKTADGENLSYELADSVTQKRGLAAMSESSAAEGLDVKPQIRRNLFRTLINSMVEDGLF